MILSLIFKTHLLKQQNAANNIGGAERQHSLAMSITLPKVYKKGSC